MKRYIAVPILAAISAAAAVGGWHFGKSVQPAPRAFLFATEAATRDLVLTVHTSNGEVHEMRGKWNPMEFNNGLLTVTYVSDRIFCDSFQPSNCALVLP